MERIFNRENNIQVKLRVWFKNIHPTYSYRGIVPGYDFDIEIREKGKKKWTDPVDTDSWAYRQKSFPEERKQYEIEQKMKFVSPEELYQAFIDLWESIKPQKQLFTEVLKD